MPDAHGEVDPRVPSDRLLRDLRSRREGLSQREAERRLVSYGPNELQRTASASWWRDVVRQFNHPLALLLAVAALLALASGSPVVAGAIVAVIIANATFAFVQEQQAERAVEALAAYLPQRATVVRDGTRRSIEAHDLVPGDILEIAEGDKISADARLLSGALEVETSALTGESVPVYRSAELVDTDVPFLQARDLVFSGTSCTGGAAQTLVFATGMHTELGRIAALSERVAPGGKPARAPGSAGRADHRGRGGGHRRRVPAPRDARAGLSFADAAVFAVGLIVANVPEGLLPTITLALALGVRVLARRGALVKRLSAVETLGSTSVICTDKTGTLTENRMRVMSVSTLDRDVDIGDRARPGRAASTPRSAAAGDDHRPRAATPTSSPPTDPGRAATPPSSPCSAPRCRSEPMSRVSKRDELRRRQFHFDPSIKLMSTVDQTDDGLWVHTKGAPEAVLPRCATVMATDGREQPLTPAIRDSLDHAIDEHARGGLRVLAVARRRVDEAPDERDEAERALCFLGTVAMFDPPRAEVAASGRGVPLRWYPGVGRHR